jgi:hypothetical protein
MNDMAGVIEAERSDTDVCCERSLNRSIASRRYRDQSPSAFAVETGR